MQRRRAAFSLAEVVIALAVVSFVLLCLMGLMSVGLDAERQAHTDDVQAIAVRTMVSTLSRDFADVAPPKVYFNYDGTTNATPEGAYLECSAQDVVRSNNDAMRPEAVEGMRRVCLLLRYPLEAPPLKQTTRRVYFTISDRE